MDTIAFIFFPVETSKQLSKGSIIFVVGKSPINIMEPIFV